MSSVGEIEAEIAHTRAKLYDNIDRIQDKLTVAGIVDEMLGSAGVPRYENGHDFVLGIMRRHPVPTLIAAAGIGWFVYRLNRRYGRASQPAEIADAEFVDVPAISDGRARVYDPDRLPRRPSLDSIESRDTY